jgi:hypothetical protein
VSDGWYEATGRKPASRSATSVFFQMERAERAARAAQPMLRSRWMTLPCQCEEETDLATGVRTLHYQRGCWRHAPEPPYVIQEEP